MSSTAAPAEVTGGAGGAILAVLQRVGRSLMMPIVVLPPAALLLRLGQPDLLGRSQLGWLDAIADVISASGQPSSTPYRCCSPSAWRSGSPGDLTAPLHWPHWSATSCSIG
jgi:hypothetical protein